MSKKNHRSLEEIGAAYQAADTANIFVLGDILLEGKENHRGNFLPWLEENEQEICSVRSAENYMGAALLKRRFANIANLKVAKTTIYALVAFDKDHPKLTVTAIGALKAEAQAKGARLTTAEAARIMEMVRLRAKFGDYPDATLDALDDIATTKNPEPWHDKTTKALKVNNPKTEEEAEAITLGVLQEHVVELYHATLPAFDEHAKYILEKLAAVPANDRHRVYLELCKAKEPVTEAMAYAILNPPTAPASSPASTTAAPTTPPESKPTDADGPRPTGREQSAETEEVCDYCKKPGTLGAVTNGDGRQARLHRECEAPWLAKEKPADPKAIIRACLAEVVPVLRGAIASLDAESRLVLLDELRKATGTLIREVTVRDADANHWTETLGAAQ
jgi:hypothetical protein